MTVGSAPPVRERVRRRVATLGDRLRRSLTLRVALISAGALLVAIAVVGWAVSHAIRDGLFEARVEQVERDATWRLDQAQAAFDETSVTNPSLVQVNAQAIIRDIPEPGSGVAGAMLLRPPDHSSATQLFDVVTNEDLLELPSQDLRAQVRDGTGLYWQSVAIPSSDGAEPGIVVGGEVNVPLAGTHELYLVYSLAPEQASIDLMMRTLGIGAIALIVTVALIVAAVMWRVLTPVRQAALQAERLAAGVLDARMTVRGDDELATLGRSFNEMADSLKHQIDQLEELSRLQQRFVSDVSHELRTPLTTIRMASDMLFDARGEFGPLPRRSTELLHAQLDRFESMLADLLEISRFDAGAAVLDPEEQDLRAIVTRVVEFAEPLAEKQGVAVRLHGFDHPAAASMDGRRVERIVRNLVVNAIEHAAGRPVDVWVDSSPSAVAVRVVDTGTGMSPATAAHVFDRFWRADPARARTTGGTGLGLAISLEDARLHGGTLEAWGEAGVVAAFLLTLPRRVGEPFEPPMDVVPPQLAAAAAEGDA